MKNAEDLLRIPANTWFGPSDLQQGNLETWPWLKALASAHYERPSDGAILTANERQFQFRWHVEQQKEEAMNTETTIETINWSALSAEQRDELVATYVMHQRVVHLPAQQVNNFTLPEIAALVDENGSFISSVPHYTQSMDAAWLVMEHLRNTAVILTHITSYTHCRIESLEGQSRAHHGTRVSAAEAICIAALRKVGIGIKHAAQHIITADNHIID